MSTLSEIAANHANATKALDAESAMFKALCSAAPNICEGPFAAAQAQAAIDDFAVINKSLTGVI